MQDKKRSTYDKHDTHENNQVGQGQSQHATCGTARLSSSALISLLTDPMHNQQKLVLKSKVKHSELCSRPAPSHMLSTRSTSPPKSA